jgi:hypothetical protein
MGARGKWNEAELRRDEIPGRRIDGARACQRRAESEWQTTGDYESLESASQGTRFGGTYEKILFSSVY